MDQGIGALGHRPVALVLRALGLGDLLTAVPALKALRRGLPEHRVLLATSEWLAPVVDLVPAIDRLLPQSGLEGRPDVGSVDIAVNLHGNGPQSRALLAAVGARRTIGYGLPDAPEWDEGEHERMRWVRLVESAGLSGDPDDVGIEQPAAPSPAPGATVLHVGAAFGSRQWPVERFAAVARSLGDDGHRIVFSGSAAERDRALEAAALGGFPEHAVLAGAMPLDAFAALVASARLVVTGDTGAAHLANAFVTPSVVLFGPASPERWGPPPGPHIVLTDASRRVGDLFGDDPDPALLAVSVDDVVRAVAALQ